MLFSHVSFIVIFPSECFYAHITSSSLVFDTICGVLGEVGMFILQVALHRLLVAKKGVANSTRFARSLTRYVRLMPIAPVSSSVKSW